MAEIDNPLDQLEFVQRDEPRQGLAQLLNLSGLVTEDGENMPSLKLPQR
jgi:hypothetical protein